MKKTQEEYPLLVAQEGPLKGQRWQLSQTIVLGREPSCDVVVADRQMRFGLCCDGSTIPFPDL